MTVHIKCMYEYSVPPSIQKGRICVRSTNDRDMRKV